ncbi:MAG TPA: ankyrin repeat domain-containing protein [Vicinamibacteria bacterium]|nr:ankyrin repeat domain-containing protein [Vicinamibacteria bacterium]
MTPIEFRLIREFRLGASSGPSFPEGHTIRGFGFVDEKAKPPDAPLTVGILFVHEDRAFVFRRELDGAFLRPRAWESLKTATAAPSSPASSCPVAQLSPWPEGFPRPSSSDVCVFSLSLAGTAYTVFLRIGRRTVQYERPLEELLSVDTVDPGGRVEHVQPEDLTRVLTASDPALLRAAFAEHPAYRNERLPGGSQLPLAWWAISSERMDLLEIVLELGAELNQALPKVGCPLHLAASRGFRDAVVRLVAAGADPNAADLEGKRPLHRTLQMATRESDRERFLELYDDMVRLGANENLASGPNPSPKETRWLLVLHEAVKSGDVARVRALLAEPIGERAVPVADVPFGTRTAFALAVAEGYVSVIEALYPHTSGQATLDAVLPIAIGHHRLEAAAWLLARGADCNRVAPVQSLTEGLTQGGDTPLHVAARGPNRRMAELLLKYGAEVNALDPNGATPLILASQRAFGHKTVALLLDYGADRSLRDHEGKTALDYAKRWSYPRTIDALTKEDD